MNTTLYQSHRYRSYLAFFFPSVSRTLSATAPKFLLLINLLLALKQTYATAAEGVGHDAQLPPSAFSTRSLSLRRLWQAPTLNDWMQSPFPTSDFYC
jgi:hypothetical protein